MSLPVLVWTALDFFSGGRIEVFPLLAMLFILPDQTIDPRNHFRHNGSMLLSQVQIILQWCASFMEFLLPLIHTCQGYRMFAIHSRHATMNFTCSSTLSHQETKTTPLCSSLLASISNAGQTHFTLCSPPEQYRKKLYGRVRFHYACLLPWQYRYVTTVLPALWGMCFMAGVQFSFDCLIFFPYEINIFVESTCVSSYFYPLSFLEK